MPAMAGWISSMTPSFTVFPWINLPDNLRLCDVRNRLCLEPTHYRSAAGNVATNSGTIPRCRNKGDGICREGTGSNEMYALSHHYKL